MKKLSKRDIERRNESIEELKKLETELDEAAVEVNRLIDDKLNPIIDRYNEALATVEGFRDDVVAAIEAEIEGKSEAWQEGDRGVAFTEWKDEWEQNLSTDELEHIEAIELPDTPQAAELEALPEEPSL